MANKISAHAFTLGKPKKASKIFFPSTTKIFHGTNAITGHQTRNKASTRHQNQLKSSTKTKIDQTRAEITISG